MSENIERYRGGKPIDLCDYNDFDDTELIYMWDKSIEQVHKMMAADSKENVTDSEESTAESEENAADSQGNVADSKENVFNTKENIKQTDNTGGVIIKTEKNEIVSNDLDVMEYDEDSTTSDSSASSLELESIEKFYVGQIVMAPYSEDKRKYKAVITKMMPEKQTCTVEFKGYGNREEVPIASLQKFLRRTDNRQQWPQPDSRQEWNQPDSRQEFLQPDSRQQWSEPDSRPQLHQPGNLNEQATRYSRDPPQKNIGAHVADTNLKKRKKEETVIPGITPPVLHGLNHVSTSETKAFNAMLMSWYMNGYNTGFYEGFKQGKEEAMRNLTL